MSALAENKKIIAYFLLIWLLSYDELYKIWVFKLKIDMLMMNDSDEGFFFRNLNLINTFLNYSNRWCMNEVVSKFNTIMIWLLDSEAFWILSDKIHQYVHMVFSFEYHLAGINVTEILELGNVTLVYYLKA